MQDGLATKRRKTLAQYVQPAIGGDQGALAKIYGVDPQAGVQVQQQAGAFKKESQQQLADFTRVVSTLADKGDMQGAADYYRANVGGVQRATGMQFGPELQDQMLPHIKQVAETLNPQTAQQGFTLGAGQTRFGADGKPIASAPAAAPKDPDEIRTLRLLQQNPDLLGVKERLAAAGRAPSGGGSDLFAKNKAFADQLRASGAISTPEEYKQVLTTGKVQQSDADVQLSPADEATAQGIARYAVLPSSLGRSKNRGALIARAMQINPDYNEAQAKSAYTYLNDLGKSGPTSAGGLVQSMNTLLEHGKVLLDANEALHGTGSQTVNRVKNALSSEFGGTAAPNFNQAVNFYSQELGKLVKGGVANEGEVRDIIRDLDPSRTPEQRSQAILQAMEFVHGRIKAIEDRGTRVLGQMAPDTSLLTKESQDILSRAYREAGQQPPAMPPPGDNKGYVKAARDRSEQPQTPDANADPLGLLQ